MKLHLPKQLFTALLAAITLAAAPAALTLGSTSWGAESFDSIEWGGNFWASEYSFSFVLDDVSQNGSVVAAYWGAVNTGLSSNAFTVEYNETSGTYTLNVASGNISNSNINSGTTFTKGSNGTNSASLTGLQAGVLYTVTGSSTNGTNTVMTLDSAYMAAADSTAYNGKMNNNANPIPNGVNSAYAVSGGAIVWKGTESGLSAAEATNWQTITNATPESISNTSTLIFEAVESLNKNVDVTGLGRVNAVSIYDNYSFNTTAATTLATENGIRIGSGKTLTLNSAATEVNTISGGISGGTLKIDSGSWSISGGLTSTLTLADAATLNLGDGSFISWASELANINAKANITTSGTGYVKLTGTETTLEGDITVTKNYAVTGDITVNGKGYDYADLDGRTLSIGQGKSFTVGGTFSIISRAVLDIAGGSVEADSMKLGHPTVSSNNNSTPNWGKLTMSSGSLKTGTITFQRDKQNQISITGGTLEFTDAAAINRGSNTACTVNIMGASADSRVTLKAHTAWTLDGAGLTALPTIGNVTIDAANTAGIKLDNVALSGSIVNNADLTLGAGITVASGAAATLSGSNAIQFVDTITQSGTLIISSNVAAVGLVTDFDLKKEGTGGYVLDAGNLTATNENQNGFIFTGGAEYWLVKGGENTLTGNLTLTDNSGSAFNLATSTTEGDTGIYISTGDNYVETSRYYITTGDVTVIGTGAENATGAGTYVLQGGTMQLAGGTVKSSEILYTSGAINLASGSSLLLDSSDNAASYITTTTTGAGNIEIGTTVTLDKGSSTQENFAGSLVVNRGGELILVRKSGGSAAADETVSLADVTLNGGQLSFTGGNTTLDKLTVKAESAGSKFYIFDMLGADGRATTTFTISNLELNAGMQIQSGYKSHLKIDSLSGTGELQLLQRANTDYQVVDINAGTGYTGLLNLDGGASMTVNLNIAQGATTKIKADNASTIEKVVLADGAKLAYDTKHSAYTYTINNVEIAGEATIAMEASATYHEGCLNIGNLVNAEGSENGELTLSSNYRNSTRNIINLNGGDFSGKINYVASSTDSRKHGFNINHETVAEHAEINISDNNSNTNSIALGIGVERVKVKALSGGNGNVAIYSGQQAYGNSNVFGALDTTFRTLEIATNSGEYTANMAIKNYLNLEKSGAGSQEITGSMSDFNGTIKVTGGTLTLSGLVGTSAVATAGAVTVTDGLLEFKNTSYVSDVHMSGGNLTYGGSGVTHTITGTLDTPDGAGTGDSLKVESGTNLVVGTLQNAWGIQTVVDGTLTATNLIISYGQQAGSTSGAGSITTTGMEAKNYGNLRYEISVHELSVGSTGISITKDSNLFLNSAITLVAGATSVESGSSLNIETGSATLKGALSGAGALRVYGGSLTLEAASEIAQFTYSGGTLNHSGLTVTNATFSGGTLVNTGALTLNGTLNIENQSALTESGTASYSDGDNGFYRGSYYVIKSDGETGTSLTLGEEGFALQLMGTAVSDSSTSGANYWSKDEAGNLLLTIQDNSGTYYVNKNTVTVGGSSATAGVEAASAFHVASGAKLDIAELPTGWTAAELLAGKVAGAGTLLVSKSDLVTGEITTTFRGTLELAGGVTLTLGETVASAANEAKVVNTTSLNKVILNEGSRLQYQGNGSGTEFKDLTVNGSGNLGATIYIIDGSSGEANAVKLTGNTQLNHTLNLTSQYGARYTISNLSGTGTLNAQGTGNESFFTTIQGLNGFQGTINFTDTNNHTVVVSTGTEAELVSFDSLQFTAGEGITNTFNVQTNTSVGTVNMAGGTVNLAAGTTLTLGQTGEGAQATTSSIGTVNVASGAGTIYLNEKASLETITKTGEGTLTLNGSGTYTLASGASSLGTGVVLGAANNGWTGTVAVSDTTQTNQNGEVFAFASGYDTLFNATSTLQVTNAKGYLQGELTANLNLVNGNGGFAMQLANGSTGSSYNAEFSGSITGFGNIVYVWERYSGENATTHIFSNDTSTWKGQFIRDIDGYNADNAKGKVTNVHFTHGGNVFSAADDSNGGVIDMDNSGRLNVTIAADSTKTIFNGTLENIATVTVNSVTDFTKDATTNKLVVANEQTATLTGESNSITAGNVKISQKDASLSNVTVQSGSIAATSTADGAKGSISGALVEMQSATSFSISDMVLSNVKLSAVAGASVALNNVSGTAELAGAGSYNIGTGAAQYTLGMTPAQVGTIENDNGGTALTLSYSSNTAITMSGTGSQLLLSADPTVDANGIFGTYNLTLTLNYALDGIDVPTTTADWQELVGFTGILGDLLTAQTPEATVDLAEGEAAVAAAGTTPTVEYNYTAPGEGAQVGTLVITINGLNVPEPASATLGLAALMMLCARRRRKA